MAELTAVLGVETDDWSLREMLWGVDASLLNTRKLNLHAGQHVAAIAVAPVEVEVASEQFELVGWEAIEKMDRHVRIGVVTTAPSGTRPFNECEFFSHTGLGVARVGGYRRLRHRHHEQRY